MGISMRHKEVPATRIAHLHQAVLDTLNALTLEPMASFIEGISRRYRGCPWHTLGTQPVVTAISGCHRMVFWLDFVTNR